MKAHFRKPRILIVDDNSLIRELIKSFFDDYDVEMLEAGDGQQAVEMARACSPDLIMLDIQLPVLNGYEAAAILKNDDAVKGIPILVITSQGHAEVADRIKGLYAGCVSKPFQQGDLIEATLRCLPGVYKSKREGCEKEAP